MSFNPATSCCCGTTLCCLAVKVAHTCQKAKADGCGSSPDGTQTLEYWKYLKFCVNSEDECSCALIDNPGSGNDPTETVIECHSTFRPDKKCENNVPPTGVCEEPAPKICPVWGCSPCGPIQLGCVLTPPDQDCPPVPDCPIDPCCNPTQKLCCCREIVSGCVTGAQCTTCTGPSSTGTGTNGTVCTEVQNCTGCTPDLGVYITTMCCATCNYVDIDGDGAWDVFFQDCQNMPTLVCCADCQTPGCTGAACIPPCSGGQPPPNLCPCPISPSVTPCSGFTSNYRYGTSQNSAENRYTTGYISDGNAYKLNTLFLFGYGYDHL